MVNGASPSAFVQNQGNSGQYLYFQDSGSAGGHYLHNPRRIFDTPPVYEFATPIKGTVPIWTDPSYWSDGLVPRVHLNTHLQVIHKSVASYLEMIFGAQAPLLVAFLVLCFLARTEPFVRQIAARWPLLLIGLTGLAMYSFVLVLPRYVAVFFALCWVGLFSSLSVPSSRNAQRTVLLVTLATSLVMTAPVAITAVDHTYWLRPEPNTFWQVAEDLRSLGVQPGDRVGRIGASARSDWARLLRVSVVADIPHDDARQFWNASPEIQAQVIQALQRVGVTVIVAEPTPASDVFISGPGWVKLGHGGYYAWKISPDR